MENTTQSRFAVTETDEGIPQVALLANDFEITNPLESECGRFTVDPQETYRVSPTLAFYLARLNQQLRFESGDLDAAPTPDEEILQPHPEPSQQQYVHRGFNTCPQCGNHAIRGGDIEVAGNTAHQGVSCETCGAAWNDLYQLVGYEITEDGSARNVKICLIENDIEELSTKVSAARSALNAFGPAVEIIGPQGAVSLEAHLEQLLVSQKSLENEAMLLKMSEPYDQRFAETVIGGAPGRFDAIEIHGVRHVGWDEQTQRTIVEVDEENPHLWSVYLHRVEGGLECVGDLSSPAVAEQYARLLSKQYGYHFG